MEAIIVERNHFDGLSDALARAFRNDPMCAYIFPDPEARVRKMRWIFERWLKAFTTSGVGYTTPELQGAAFWYTPESGTYVPPLEIVRAGLLWAPLTLNPGEQLRGLKVFLDAAIRIRRFVRQPHWVLDTLGVAPEHQNQGIARAILSPALAQADASQCPCFVITHNPVNIGIYSRMGFVLIHESPLWGLDSPVFSLRREPRRLNAT